MNTLPTSSMSFVHLTLYMYMWKYLYTFKAKKINKQE